MKSPDEYAEAVDAILTAELPAYDLTARPVVLKHVAMQRQEPTPWFEVSVDRVAACRWRLRAHRGQIRLVACYVDVSDDLRAVETRVNDLIAKL